MNASVTTIGPLVAGALTAGAALTRGESPRLRVAIGAVSASIILGIVAQGLPAFARAFAWLIILGALLGPGYDVIRALARLIQ